MRAGAGDIVDHAADAFGRGVRAMMFAAVIMVGAGVVAAGMYGAAWTISEIIKTVVPAIRG